MSFTIQPWTRKPLFRHTIRGEVNTRFIEVLKKHIVTSEQQAYDLWTANLPRWGASAVRSAFSALIDRHDFIWLILRDGSRKLFYLRPYLTMSYQRAYALCEAAQDWQLDGRMNALARLGGIQRPNLHPLLCTLTLEGLLTRDASGHYLATPTNPPMPKLQVTLDGLMLWGFYHKPTPNGPPVPAPGAERREMPRQKTSGKIEWEPSERNENEARKNLAKRLVRNYVKDNPQADITGLDTALRFYNGSTGGVLGITMLPYALYHMQFGDPTRVSDLKKEYGLNLKITADKIGTQMHEALLVGYAIRVNPTHSEPGDRESSKRHYITISEEGCRAPIHKWWLPSQRMGVTDAIKEASNPVVSNFLSWAISDSATIESIFDSEESDK